MLFFQKENSKHILNFSLDFSPKTLPFLADFHIYLAKLSRTLKHLHYSRTFLAKQPHNFRDGSLKKQLN